MVPKITELINDEPNGEIEKKKCCRAVIKERRRREYVKTNML